MYLNKISLLVVLVLVVASIAFGEQSKDYFGEISIQIDNEAVKTYNIQRALLYRNVSIAFDSTILIQNINGYHIRYYPQLDKGNSKILRLIFGEHDDRQADFYDFFIDLGDSLQEENNWNNEKNKVYLSYNGTAQRIMAKSKNINGKVFIIKSGSSDAISGNLALDFNFPMGSEIDSLNVIHLEGDFDVPVGDYRKTSIGTESRKKILKDKQRNNVYLAVIMTMFIVAIFGFR